MRYKTWWVIMWGVVAATLLSLLFVIQFKWWAVLTFVTFGTMEGIGVSDISGSYPPLTRVIRRYVPQWIAFPLIYGFIGGAAVTWFNAPIGVALLVALAGWLTEHFSQAYRT